MLHTSRLLGLVLVVVSLRLNPRSWVNRTPAGGAAMLSLWAFPTAVVYSAPTRDFSNPVYQVLMWGLCLVLVRIDFAGGSYVVDVVPTAWGNAVVIEAGPRYFAQLGLIRTVLLTGMVAIRTRAQEVTLAPQVLRDTIPEVVDRHGLCVLERIL
jgi:hypothetical protein